MEEVDLNVKNSKNKKNTNNNIVWIGIIGVIILIVIVIAIVAGLKDEISSLKLDISNVTMSIDYNEYLGYSAVIIGTAKNVSKRDYKYASVEFSVYDASGINLGTALANINNLGSGDSWYFEAILLNFVSSRPTSYKLVEITTW